MFYDKYFMKYNIILKKIFPFLNQISKNTPDSGDGDVDGENFLIGKYCEK